MCNRLFALAVVVATASAPVQSIAAEPPRLTGGISTHVVRPGDSLQTVASRVGVDPSTIAADNGLVPGAKLTPGQPLRIDNRHLVPDAAGAGLTINVPQRMLFLAWEGGVVGLPVSVGQPGWQTPTGLFRIVRKEVNPTWDVPDSIREEARRAGRTLPRSIPPGPANPLGRFWLGLSMPSLGIHGTNAPTSVYRVATHGCIRLGAADIAWLHDRVEVGTPGQILYEPILLARVGDDILLEVHRDVYGRLAGPAPSVTRAAAARAGLDAEIDWSIADAVIQARHGVARSVRRR